MRLDPRVKDRLKQAFTAEVSSHKEMVTIFSTYALGHEEMNAIMGKFPQFAHSKTENKIDASLVGGIVIQCGSQLIDLSMRNALHLLKKQLYESN